MCSLVMLFDFLHSLYLSVVNQLTYDHNHFFVSNIYLFLVKRNVTL